MSIKLFVLGIQDAIACCLFSYIIAPTTVGLLAFAGGMRG